MNIKRPQFFGLKARPSKVLSKLLMVLPFILIIGVYFKMSEIRHQENPHDKILPTFKQMIEATDRMAFQEDKRTGKYLMLEDTKSSLKRIGIGIFMASLLGLLLGLNMGLLGGLDRLFSPFVTFLSIIPPLAILPILFICFGVDELAKVMLIFIGTFPMITRSIYQTTQKIPIQQITKAMTLGASDFQIIYQIILPQIIPNLINAVRLSFGAGWLFLIAAEAIASTDGLGYRIFLVRRYLSMDIIIPYTLWITILGFAIDWFLRKFISWKYPWFNVKA